MTANSLYDQATKPLELPDDEPQDLQAQIIAWQDRGRLTAMDIEERRSVLAATEAQYSAPSVAQFIRTAPMTTDLKDLEAALKHIQGMIASLQAALNAPSSPATPPKLPYAGRKRPIGNSPSTQGLGPGAPSATGHPPLKVRAMASLDNVADETGEEKLEADKEVEHEEDNFFGGGNWDTPPPASPLSDGGGWVDNMFSQIRDTTGEVLASSTFEEGAAYSFVPSDEYFGRATNAPPVAPPIHGLGYR